MGICKGWKLIDTRPKLGAGCIRRVRVRLKRKVSILRESEAQYSLPRSVRCIHREKKSTTEIKINDAKNRYFLRHKSNEVGLHIQHSPKDIYFHPSISRQEHSNTHHGENCERKKELKYLPFLPFSLFFFLLFSSYFLHPSFLDKKKHTTTTTLHSFFAVLPVPIFVLGNQLSPCSFSPYLSLHLPVHNCPFSSHYIKSNLFRPSILLFFLFFSSTTSISQNAQHNNTLTL